MSIIRVEKNKENPYVLLNKKFLEDDNLSWKAKGLMSYLLSRPDNWHIYLEQLKKVSKDNKTATSNAIKELINNGYIAREKMRYAGKFRGYNYIIYESKEHRVRKTATENPSTENRQLLNNDLTKTNLDNKKLSKLHTDFISLFCEKYKLKYGIPYKFQGAKDGSHIKKLIKYTDNDIEKYKTILDIAFDDIYWIKNKNISPAIISSQFNQFNAKAYGNVAIMLSDTAKKYKEWFAMQYKIKFKADYIFKDEDLVELQAMSREHQDIEKSLFIRSVMCLFDARDTFYPNNIITFRKFFLDRWYPEALKKRDEQLAEINNYS